MPEIDPLIFSYSHLPWLPKEEDALHTLKKVASLVKPLMRRRGWQVNQLAEFYPTQDNLLGLNVSKGQKIYLRLRHPGDHSQFVPIEQVIDTMLHELAHIEHGPHNAEFNALWRKLREEHDTLTRKGYTGEGFLSNGNRVGGRRMPMDEARRLARIEFQKLRNRQQSSGSGQRLGGATPRSNKDMRAVIADAAESRKKTMQGCGNNNRSEDEIRQIVDTATRNGFKTQAEEDAANEVAIAQAQLELIQEDEERARKEEPTQGTSSEFENLPSGPSKVAESHMTWNCHVCTLTNPLNFLVCDACGNQRGEGYAFSKAAQKGPSKQSGDVIDLTRDSPPKSKPSRAASSIPRSSRPHENRSQASVSQSWTCHTCGRVREKQWWSCDLCGTIKRESK